MGSARPALVRYVYLDIVEFSRGRSIEAQSDILTCLGQVVAQAVGDQVPVGDQVLFLPTGDGICVCLVNLIHPFDLDIRIALAVLEHLHQINRQQVDASRRFEVRIGINENQDNLIRDIKGGLNVVGLGINMAQRVMSVAGPSRLMLGQAVHERLSQRELYRHWLRPMPAIVKHGCKLLCYEYFNPTLACFGKLEPLSVSATTASNPASTSAASVLALPLEGAQGRRRNPRGPTPPPSFQIGRARRQG